MESKPAVAVFHHIGPYHYARLNAAADRLPVTGFEWSAKAYGRRYYWDGIAVGATIWNSFGKQVAQFAARFGPDRFGEGLERAARMAIEVKQKRFGVIDRALLLAAATLQR